MRKNNTYKSNVEISKHWQYKKMKYCDKIPQFHSTIAGSYAWVQCSGWLGI